MCRCMMRKITDQVLGFCNFIQIALRVDLFINESQQSAPRTSPINQKLCALLAHIAAYDAHLRDAMQCMGKNNMRTYIFDRTIRVILCPFARRLVLLVASDALAPGFRFPNITSRIFLRTQPFRDPWLCRERPPTATTAKHRYAHVMDRRSARSNSTQSPCNVINGA